MDIKLLALKFYDHSSYIRGYSKATIRRYRFAITFYCKVMEIQNIEQVTNDNIRQFFFYGRTARGWQPSTFQTIHKSLLVFFRWCVNQQYLQHNPVEDLEVPNVEKRLPPKLTRQDAFRLLEVVYNYPYDSVFLRSRNHAILSTFLFAGLRNSELLKLRFTDVDLDNLTIYVHQGKGSKDRIVPMSHTLAQSLKRYLEERKKLRKTCPEFFASSNRNMGFTNTGLKRLVEKIRKSASINFTVHMLRHTFATLMLEGGCDIYSLSRMMGHSAITTTTIYLAASPEHLRSQMLKHPLNGM